MASGAVSRQEVLGLYRHLLRHGRQFADYNFRLRCKGGVFHLVPTNTHFTALFCCRKYAERKVRDAFREKRFLSDPQRIHAEYTYGLEQLQLLKRQVQTTALVVQ